MQKRLQPWPREKHFHWDLARLIPLELSTPSLWLKESPPDPRTSSNSSFLQWDISACTSPTSMLQMFQAIYSEESEGGDGLGWFIYPKKNNWLPSLKSPSHEANQESDANRAALRKLCARGSIPAREFNISSRGKEKNKNIFSVCTSRSGCGRNFDTVLS